MEDAIVVETVGTPEAWGDVMQRYGATLLRVRQRPCLRRRGDQESAHHDWPDASDPRAWPDPG